MSNGADVTANALLEALTAGETIAWPTVDLDDPAFEFPSIENNQLYEQVVELTNENLTTRTVGGTGTYDAIMASQAAHLKDEFNAGRITGAEYTKAYVALAQAACGQAIQYLLGKEQAYWASVNAQGQALIGKVQLEIAKAQLATALIEVKNMRVTFAINKIRLANEDAQYGISKYTLENMMPMQLAMLTAQKTGQTTANEIASYNLTTTLPLQTAGQTTANSTATYNLNSMLPMQLEMLTAQKTGQTTANSIATYNLENISPAQLALLQEQSEVQRAQTLDVRKDGAAITGSVKAQKDLYAQQVISYKRSSEINAAKVFTDAWVADSAIQDSPILPAAFSAENISSVLTTIKAANNL